MKIGTKAPDFKLKDKTGKTFSLSSLKGEYTVLYFYPKDDTPGCTIEAQEFTKNLAKFKTLKTAVVGISGGDEKTKTAFCKKYGLKVTLLSDPNFSVAKKYGAFGKKSFMGKSFQGIFRNTYLLDKNKKVLKVFEKVQPETHSKELLSFISTWGKSGAKTTKTTAKTMAKTTKKTTTKTTAKKTATKTAAPAKITKAGKAAWRKTTPKATTKTTKTTTTKLTTKKTAATKKTTTAAKKTATRSARK